MKRGDQREEERRFYAAGSAVCLHVIRDLYWCSSNCSLPLLLLIAVKNVNDVWMGWKMEADEKANLIANTAD